MCWLLEVCVLLFTFNAIDSVTRSAYFRLHNNKRLTATVTKTMTTDTPISCLQHCLATDGCQAVNIPTGTHRTTCELTSGVTNMSEVVNDNRSHVFVVDKCAVERGVCLNGGTCEPTWTSTRCHCIKRYQGDRCDTCADGYYGETCGTVFVRHPEYDDCLWGDNLYEMIDVHRKVCEEWCAHNATCTGFIERYGNCFFKGPQCRVDLRSDPPSSLYLKETVE